MGDRLGLLEPSSLNAEQKKVYDSIWDFSEGKFASKYANWTIMIAFWLTDVHQGSNTDLTMAGCLVRFVVRSVWQSHRTYLLLVY